MTTRSRRVGFGIPLRPSPFASSTSDAETPTSTFATFRHLSSAGDLPVHLVGVDQHRHSRDRNTALAQELGWDREMSFLAGSIAEVALDAPDVVLALHACDTATDEALARAVRWQAPLVFAAPCCHHDLQTQLRHPAPRRRTGC